MNQELPTEQLEPRRSVKLPILLLIVFAVLASARLNQFYFYTPDSGGYVLMARGLIDHLEYRQYDQPGEPGFTLRPPGMSILLIPAALIAPYDVLAAKLTVVMTALLLIWLFYALARRLLQEADSVSTETLLPLQWSVLLVSLILITNPYILFYSTIVMSEIPFAACTLAVLYLFSTSEECWSRGKLICLTGLLIFLPFLRTIGVAMILAAGLWAVVNRKRWVCLVPVGLALGATAGWMFRNSLHQSNSYGSIAIAEIKKAGVVGTIISMLNRSLVHFESLSQKLFPGMPGTVPEFGGLLSGEYHFLPGPAVLYLLASLVVYLLAFAGMLKCWKRGGAVGFLYVCLSFGVLALWPWMQTRFTLPLLPVVLVFVPAGLCYFRQSLFNQKVVLRRSLVAGGLVATLGLLLAQTWVDAKLISTNRLMITESEEELSNRDLIQYASDFVKAGAWLNENTAPSARVLTRRAEVSTASHRFQKLFYFDPAHIDQLHSAIQEIGSCYLVSYGKYTSDMFPRYLLDDDLVYRFTPVYEAAGAVVIEVQPNYEGTVREQYWRPEEPMELARKRLARNPRRLSVSMTYLNQLLKADQFDEIITFVGDLEQQGISDARFIAMLGWARLGKHQPEQALQEFARASRTPGQKQIRDNIVSGIRLALKRQKAARQGDGTAQIEQPANYLKVAETMWTRELFDRVEMYAQKVLDAKQATPSELDQAHVWMARLDLIHGKTDQALRELKQVQDPRNEAVQIILERIELEKRVAQYLASPSSTEGAREQQLDSQQEEQILKLTSLYEDQGVPGKALQLLQRASAQAPSDRQILKQLARLQLFYHLLDDAEVSYQKLQASDPDDQEIQAALAEINRLRETPRY